MSETYRVIAHNSLPLSENKIHDDAIARQLGFTGALVPGVDVYAYMAHPVVARWGLDWLQRGAIEIRLGKPVYHGKAVEIAATDGADGLALTAASDGIACANGRAWLPTPGDTAATSAVAFPSHFLSVAIPPGARRPAGEDTLAVGTRLGMAPVSLPREDLVRYLDGAQETDVLYLREGVAHPGWLLRAANSVLKESVVLGPWVHTQSRVANIDVLRVGETLHARGQVVANYEKKGHRFVEFVVELWANATRRIAIVQHVAIWQFKSGV